MSETTQNEQTQIKSIYVDLLSKARLDPPLQGKDI